MGDLKGAEMEALILAMNAQEVPLDVQIRAKEAFIERARKRLAQLDEERTPEVQSEGKRTEGGRTPVVASRTAMLTIPTASRFFCRSGPSPADGVGIATAVAPRNFSHSISRFSTSHSEEREDYVPATEVGVVEWMADRQEEMNATLMSWNLSETARTSPVWPTCDHWAGRHDGQVRVQRHSGGGGFQGGFQSWTAQHELRSQEFTLWFPWHSSG